MFDYGPYDIGEYENCNESKGPGVRTKIGPPSKPFKEGETYEHKAGKDFVAKFQRKMRDVFVERLSRNAKRWKFDRGATWRTRTLRLDQIHSTSIPIRYVEASAWTFLKNMSESDTCPRNTLSMQCSFLQSDRVLSERRRSRLDFMQVLWQTATPGSFGSIMNRLTLTPQTEGRSSVCKGCRILVREVGVKSADERRRGHGHKTDDWGTANSISPRSRI